jgi:hypothetical protein
MAGIYHADFAASMTCEVIDSSKRPDHVGGTFHPERSKNMIHPSPLLRRAILTDALISGAMALLLTFAAGPLAPLLNMPEPLLRETGLFLIGFVAFLGWLASRSAMLKPLVLLLIGGNALWTLGSLALLLSGAVSPNLLGTAFVAAQAVAVGVFAQLQYLGLRRSGGARIA